MDTVVVVVVVVVVVAVVAVVVLLLIVVCLFVCLSPLFPPIVLLLALEFRDLLLPFFLHVCFASGLSRELRESDGDAVVCQNTR